MKEKISKEKTYEGMHKNPTSHISPHTSDHKGITLIALVITIIVMLILVAVTITVAINGGLFNYAGKAARETGEARDAEQNLANGRVQVGDTWYNNIDDYLNNIPSDDQNEGTLKVTLKVNEAQVTGETIPITVEKVTKREDDTQSVEGNLTYEWYYEENNKYKDGDTHKFEGLSEDKTYTLKCKVVAPDGSWGVGSVTVISFKIYNKFYRATEGMTWDEFYDSEYDKTPPDLTGFGEHDHSSEPVWTNLGFGWDGHLMGFGCLSCKYYDDNDYGTLCPGASVSPYSSGWDVIIGSDERSVRHFLGSLCIHSLRACAEAFKPSPFPTGLFPLFC